MNQSEDLKHLYVDGTQEWESVHVQVSMIVLGFASHWLNNWLQFVQPITGRIACEHRRISGCRFSPSQK